MMTPSKSLSQNADLMPWQILQAHLCPHGSTYVGSRCFGHSETSAIQPRRNPGVKLPHSLGRTSPWRRSWVTPWRTEQQLCRPRLLHHTHVKLIYNVREGEISLMLLHSNSICLNGRSPAQASESCSDSRMENKSGSIIATDSKHPHFWYRWNLSLWQVTNPSDKSSGSLVSNQSSKIDILLGVDLGNEVWMVGKTSDAHLYPRAKPNPTLRSNSPSFQLWWNSLTCSYGFVSNVLQQNVRCWFSLFLCWPADPHLTKTKCNAVEYPLAAEVVRGWRTYRAVEF